MCTHLRLAAATLFVKRKGVNEAVTKPPSGNTQAVGKCKCSCLGTCLFPFSPSSGFPVQGPGSRVQGPGQGAGVTDEEPWEQPGWGFGTAASPCDLGQVASL